MVHMRVPSQMALNFLHNLAEEHATVATHHLQVEATSRMPTWVAPLMGHLGKILPPRGLRRAPGAVGTVPARK